MSTITGPHDPERTLAKPATLTAKTLGDVFAAQHDRIVKAAMNGTDAEVYDDVLAICADEVLTALKSHGWLTEGYFTAAKAERDGK